MVASEPGASAAIDCASTLDKGLERVEQLRLGIALHADGAGGDGQMADELSAVFGVESHPASHLVMVQDSPSDSMIVVLSGA